MAADQETNDNETAPPRECFPCRGTGRVVSNLGGSPSEVECPWCDGTGRFIPGHNAQARHRPDAEADAR